MVSNGKTTANGARNDEAIAVAKDPDSYNQLPERLQFRNLPCQFL